MTTPRTRAAYLNGDIERDDILNPPKLHPYDDCDVCRLVRGAYDEARRVEKARDEWGVREA